MKARVAAVHLLGQMEKKTEQEERDKEKREREQEEKRKTVDGYLKPSFRSH